MHRLSRSRWLNSSVRRRPHIAAPQAPFALAAQAPGRRRYRAAYIAPELAAALEQKLVQLDFIREVKVTAATGSILLLFDENDAARVEALAEWLRTRIFTPSRPQGGQGVQSGYGSQGGRGDCSEARAASMVRRGPSASGYGTKRAVYSI